MMTIAFLVVVLALALAGSATSVAASSRHHRHRHHHSAARLPNVVAVRADPSVSCAKSISAALRDAGCDAIIRTDVQSHLMSMCSYEIMNACDHRSALANLEGVVSSHPVRLIPRPKPIDPPSNARDSYDPQAEFIKSRSGMDADAIHNVTGVRDARNKLGLTGKGIKVAIIDTGVYYLHPALGGGFGPGFKVAFGYDLVGDSYNGSSWTMIPDNDPLDNCTSHAHGTHVAGIVAANATGITKLGTFWTSTPFTGAAPKVTLGAYRVFGCDGEAADDIVAAAIIRAAKDGADIINLSLGDHGYSDNIAAVAAQVVARAGHIVVAANGNAGSAGAYVSGTPAVSSSAIAVASFGDVYAFSLSDWTDLKMSPFSSPGLSNDLFIKPDLSGPGSPVYSTISLFAAESNDRGQAYRLLSGTSMAAPYISGCIALLLQKRGKIGFTTARAYLQNTATVTNIYNTSMVNSPAYQGAGWVDIYKAATTGTLITPSSLSLNDTANHKKTQTIRIENSYSPSAGPITYRLWHLPGATVNTFQSGDDFFQDRSTTTFTTSNKATVTFGSRATATATVIIKPGKAATINLTFVAPVPARPDLWPTYGGYIAIQNSFDNIVSHVPYAGVAGVWKNRHIWSRNSSSLFSRSGVKRTGLYANDSYTPLTTLEVVNVSANFGLVLAPAASASRSANITITYLCKNDTALKALGLQRTNFVALMDMTERRTPPYYIGWKGVMPRNAFKDAQIVKPPHVYAFDGSVMKNETFKTTAKLPPGVYQMNFVALRNFAFHNTPDGVDVITTLPFQLIYKTPLSKKTLADCQV